MTYFDSTCPVRVPDLYSRIYKESLIKSVAPGEHLKEQKNTSISSSGSILLVHRNIKIFKCEKIIVKVQRVMENTGATY